MQERLAIQSADSAAARGERLLNGVGGEEHGSFEDDHLAQGTDYVIVGELVYAAHGDREKRSSSGLSLIG